MESRTSITVRTIDRVRIYWTIADVLARRHMNHDQRRKRMLVLYRMISNHIGELIDVEAYPQTLAVLHALQAILSDTIDDQTHSHTEVKDALHLFTDVCSIHIGVLEKALPKTVLAAVAVDDIPF